MTVRQVIAISIDYVDSISTDFRIIDSPKPITVDDTDLLNYIFSIKLPDDNISIDIMPISEVVTSFDKNMPIDFIAFEKREGKHSIKQMTVALPDFNSIKVRELLATQHNLHYHSRTLASSDFNEDNYVVVFDKNVHLRSNEINSAYVKKKLERLNITTNYALVRGFTKATSDKGGLTIDIYYFPSNNVIIEHLLLNKKDQEPEESLSTHFL